jgi:aconitate hydratase
VEPSLAGPRRPQDRVPLRQAKSQFHAALPSFLGTEVADPEATVESSAVPCALDGESFNLQHGSVVIAAITSCTNTSNPSVMIAAGLVAKKAVERGLAVPPWVKTSLAPGSKVVTDYLVEAGLMPYLEQLRFHLVGYGCMTCIGNSGPLPEPVRAAIDAGRLVSVSVLSGNRNFEGRISPDVRANYLASPPLVVAYALAGRMDLDLYHEPLGTDQQGQPVFLRDIWPTRQEVQETMERAVRPEMFTAEYAQVFEGSAMWRALAVPEGDLFAWQDDSTYVKHPPYFVDLPAEPEAVADIHGARVLVSLGDSVTTDHISPAGSIKRDSPAGRYLEANGVPPAEFNSYGSRRGNHEVMMRGTFANIRLRNKLVPGVEGGFTLHLPDGAQLSIYDAAMQYRAEGVPLLILAGKEYGSGSSRDWAAKGPRLLGVRAVIAESYERIHRSNLIGMGILPLQYRAGENAETLGLSGLETFDIEGLADQMRGEFAPGREVTVRATAPSGTVQEFRAVVRIDTPQERHYYQHGGILQYVLRQLLRD